jgi:hypothetical protein
LLSAGAGRSALGDDAGRTAPPDQSLVVSLRIPGDEEFAKVHDILDKVKKRGATRWKVRAAGADEGASAEVISKPQTPSKRIAGVVEQLLDCGIKKISVEVKE